VIQQRVLHACRFVDGFSHIRITGNFLTIGPSCDVRRRAIVGLLTVSMPSPGQLDGVLGIRNPRGAQLAPEKILTARKQRRLTRR